MSADPGPLRALPAVDRLAEQIAAAEGVGFREAVAVARAVLEERRAELRQGAGGDPDLLVRAAARLRRGLRRVVNATGVVVHTNLGRAPLPQTAVEALAATSHGYTDLELDLRTGRRGPRAAALTDLLCELTGAADALVVNNGAAATLLAVAALAGRDGAVVVSRGQAVEIGGGFRVPEVVAQAGARLVEVGTTNRTRAADYDAALVPGAIVLRVHPSNFRTLGFTEDVAVEELVGLGAPVVDDVGSGSLATGIALLDDEPPVPRSVAAGAALTCFSGDKLLGGPQAGILVGTRDAVEAARRHPLARALRAGRLTVAALEATLRLYRDPERARREIPVLAMLTAAGHELQARAQRIARAAGGEVVEAVAKVGGGALPLAELTGPAVALPGDPEAVARRLRGGDPPILARIADGRVLIDPRTLLADEVDAVVEAVGR